MSKFRIEVGRSVDEVLADTVKVWRQAETGKVHEADEVLTFADWSTFIATFTDARVNLLRHLAECGPATSINALANDLHRPYRRVHDDVSALLAVDVLWRKGTEIGLAAERFSAVLDVKGHEKRARAGSGFP